MFKLNRDQAAQFDNRGSFINEAGKYVGAFTRVEWIDNPKNGSTGLGITFVSNEKQEANFYINLSYQHGTGNESGNKLVNAMLACFRLEESGGVAQTKVQKYNADTKKTEESLVPCFIHLMNKPIGLIIQMKFEKDSTSEHPKPTIYSVFEASTELLASEIVKGISKPEKLAKVVEYIASKPLVDSRKAGAIPPPPTKQTSYADASGAMAPDNFESDIPF